MLALFVAAAVLGQQPSTPTPPTTTLPLGDPLQLAQDYYTVESIGVSVRVPIGGSLDTTTRPAGGPAVVIFDPGQRWRIQLHHPASQNKTLTLADVTNDMVHRLELARGVRRQDDQRLVGTETRLLLREKDLLVSGFPAERFYVELPRQVGSRIVNGYTIVHTAPGQFMIFQLDCVFDDLPTARATYEKIIDEARLRDPADAAATRAALTLASQKVLDALNRKDIEGLLPTEPIWLRMHRVDEDGQEQEIAWQRFEARVGQRGELEPTRSRDRWTAVDREYGFVASIAGRFLDGATVVDSESIAFLSFTREQESWTTRMTIRSGPSTAHWTETGAREGDDVQVTVDQPGQTPLIKHWKAPPSAYISQVLQQLIPRVLVRQGAAASFGFYRYHSATSDVQLRTDEFRAVSDADRAPPGTRWVLRTRTTVDAGEEVRFLDEVGAALRRTLPDGAVVEPMPLEKLRGLWRAKGLPMT